jgi:RNA polymerase sigma-70 factor (ECF subfamily)
MNALTIATLFDAHSARLRLFARQFAAVPEDLVQEAFLALVRQKPPPHDPVAWLYRVVRNLGIDASRMGRRREQREQASARPEAWFAQSHLDGLDATIAVEALEALPAELREVVVGRIWGELSFEQIAGVVGCSVSSAHRRFAAGISALREKLGES